MTSFLLMNINDLGATAVSSVVQSISSSRYPFYKILLGNYRGNP